MARCPLEVSIYSDDIVSNSSAVDCQSALFSISLHCVKLANKLFQFENKSDLTHMARSPLEVSRYADDIVSSISSIDCQSAPFSISLHCVKLENKLFLFENKSDPTYITSSSLKVSRYTDDIISDISAMYCLTFCICYFCDISFVEDVWKLTCKKEFFKGQMYMCFNKNPV